MTDHETPTLKDIDATDTLRIGKTITSLAEGDVVKATNNRLDFYLKGEVIERTDHPDEAFHRSIIRFGRKTAELYAHTPYTGLLIEPFDDTAPAVTDIEVVERATPDEERSETVTIKTETAEVALRELEFLIERTGGDDGHEMTDVDGQTRAMTPLALTRRRIKQLPPDARAHAVLEIIDEVGDQTGAETNPGVDPLTDGVFRARADLREVLEWQEVDDDR